MNEAERYVNERELATLMGVSVRTIRDWRAEGMPSESWGMRVRRYLPSQCIEWARTMRESRTRRIGSGEDDKEE